MDQFYENPSFDAKKVNWTLLEITKNNMLHTYLIDQCDIKHNNNCKVPLNNLQCKECDEGYFLDNFKCHKNPSGKI